MHLLLRADATTAMGSGHVMRCLALAQACQAAGGQASFALAAPAPALEARLAAENCPATALSGPAGSAADATATAALAQHVGADWVVADGYQFGAKYQQALKQAGLRVLFIDDYGHAGHYSADLVLNQNLAADEQFYASREADTRLLLGARYILLRREFWPYQGHAREAPPQARRVLVTMGGGDPDNVTLKAVEALGQSAIEGLEAIVVIGASNPHAAELAAACAASKAGLQLKSNVSDMPALMAWANLAISAGGSTCWELAFMGVPTLALILADNQRQVAEPLQAQGAALNLGEHRTLTPAALAAQLDQLAADPARRAALIRSGQALVDGEGPARVLMHLAGERFWLRPARPQDCARVWEWVNDPVSRAASFSSDPIAWDAHVRWFEARLNDPHAVYFIAVSAHDEPVGQIRYAVEARSATLSVSLAPQFRGQGYGSALIRRASTRLLQTADLDEIEAYVKPDNESSLRAFVKAGFANTGVRTVNGHTAIRFSLSKEALS